MNNETIAVELSALKEKVGAMLSTVEDIKEAVQQVVSVEREVSNHKIRIEHIDKRSETMWSRIDQARDEIGKVSEEGREFRDKTRGAARIAGYLLAFLQAVILALSGWLGNLVLETNRVTVRQQLIIEQLERQILRVSKREPT